MFIIENVKAVRDGNARPYIYYVTATAWQQNVGLPHK